MAISSVGSLGTSVASTSSATLDHTLTANLLSGDWVVMTIVSANSSTTDGDNSEVSSVVANTSVNDINFTKIGEYTNSEGVAASGLTTSLWIGQASKEMVGSLTTIRTTWGSARIQRAVSAWQFRPSNHAGFVILQSPITPDAVDASNGFGSVAQAAYSTPTQDVLYFRGLGKQANTTTALTPTSSFTAITNARSQDNAAARCVYGEFILQSSTGATSDPTLAVSGNTAGVFATIGEGTATDGDTRITQAGVMVLTDQEDTPIRSTQLGLLALVEEEDTPIRTSQLGLMVIHSKPVFTKKHWLGSWI